MGKKHLLRFVLSAFPALTDAAGEKKQVGLGLWEPESQSSLFLKLKPPPLHPSLPPLVDSFSWWTEIHVPPRPNLCIGVPWYREKASSPERPESLMRGPCRTYRFLQVALVQKLGCGSCCEARWDGIMIRTCHLLGVT